MPRTFTLLRTLGHGAHGTIHLAEVRDDDAFVQTLAVKQIRPECSGQPELVRRLRDEARLLGLLNHEHVVRVHGLTFIDGGLAILMEPVDGVDLSRLLAQGPVPARPAVDIVEAVADALDAAWNAIPEGQSAPLRVVHRDIKPSNVMVTRRGGVKVMDFGVARATFDSREAQTRSQQLGTARYMAPERWLRGDADHASDVFSLGITLLELVTGQPAERARLAPTAFQADIAAQLRAVEHDEVRSLIAAMCVFDPVERPTAAEVVTRCITLAPTLAGATLKQWAVTHVVEAEPVGIEPTAAATVVREDHSVQGLHPPPSSRKWPTAVAAIGGIAALGIALLFIPGSSAPLEPRTVPPRPAAPVIETSPVPSDPAPTPIPFVEVAAVAPRPAPPPPVEVEPEPAPRTRVRFVVARGLTVETDWGPIVGSPSVLEFPSDQAVEVRITNGVRAWSCTISVGRGFEEVRIQEDGCTQ